MLGGRIVDKITAFGSDGYLLDVNDGQAPLVSERQIDTVGARFCRRDVRARRRRLHRQRRSLSTSTARSQPRASDAADAQSQSTTVRFASAPTRTGAACAVGMIDEPRIFNRGLCAAEVARLRTGRPRTASRRSRRQARLSGCGRVGGRGSAPGRPIRVLIVCFTPRWRPGFALLWVRQLSESPPESWRPTSRRSSRGGRLILDGRGAGALRRGRPAGRPARNHGRRPAPRAACWRSCIRPRPRWQDSRSVSSRCGSASPRRSGPWTAVNLVLLTGTWCASSVVGSAPGAGSGRAVFATSVLAFSPVFLTLVGRARSRCCSRWRSCDSTWRRARADHA